ncbi:DUF6461 domain-containing protein [Streptomyces niveus]|uniref:DUF6461 domain-containing protein n=1 Tax=Streptomyces niveus TaxID=193462 RepID=UPI0036D3F5F3
MFQETYGGPAAAFAASIPGDAVLWDDLVARYAWADADKPEAYTFSVVAGRTEDEVIRAFGGDPGRARRMTFAEAADEQADHLYEDYELLRVVTSGEHVVAIEWGYHGSDPGIARRASAGGGEFFSVYRDVNARHQVLHAIDGRVDGVFDPAELEDAAWLDPSPEVPVRASDVSFHMDTLCAESFALMERTMGVAVDPAWIDTDVPAADGISEAVPAVTVSRVAEWALGDEAEIVARAVDVRFEAGGR